MHSRRLQSQVRRSGFIICPQSCHSPPWKTSPALSLVLACPWSVRGRDRLRAELSQNQKTIPWALAKTPLRRLRPFRAVRLHAHVCTGETGVPLLASSSNLPVSSLSQGRHMLQPLAWVAFDITSGALSHVPNDKGGSRPTTWQATTRLAPPLQPLGRTPAHLSRHSILTVLRCVLMCN